MVLRGATEQMLDDVERAVDGGVNAYKALCRCAGEAMAHLLLCAVSCLA